MSNESNARQLEALKRALGQQILDALVDDSVIEVMLNPDSSLWIDKLSVGMQRIGTVDPIRALSIIQTAAAMLETVVNEDRPILECELPLDGSRFEGLIPPLVASASFAIRKKALLVFSLEDYVAKGIMTDAQREAIEAAVVDRKNILVAGGTGTGKTTLANAVLASIAYRAGDQRIVIIEDTRELQCKAQNVVFLRTADNTDMTRLLRATMRLRPDRIVVGEVRDGSALALLKAWNTGHPGGIGTVHANNAEAALVRVGQLIQEAGVPPAPELIAEAVNIVISIKRTASGRVIDEVAEVSGWGNQSGFHIRKIA